MSVQGCHLHVDCASGAAGDMMLAALIDLGVPVSVIGDALDAIGAGRHRLVVARVVKGGIASVDVKVDTGGGSGLAHSHAASASSSSSSSDHEESTDHAHGHGGGHVHDHDHADHGHGHDGHGHGHADHGHGHDDHGHAHDGDHHHVHYADIRARILAASLTPGTKRRALDIFDRLARAEAKLHGKSVETVAFHEVGAIDSIVDIVGTAAALDWLGPVSVSCASVAMGSGTLKCAHGVLPVPAPAALEVMREAGGVMADGALARELCTPTGASILAATVTSWTPAPLGRAIGVGWGAGDADFRDRANVLRVVAMSVEARPAESVWQIEANLDDMSPELCAPASEAIFAAGALDVWWTPITMKKGRPALLLAALATQATRDQVAAAILRETTSIGVRFSPRERIVVARTMVEVATRYGTIAVKVAGDNAAPEYEACAAAAKVHGVPVKLVFAATLAAYELTVR